MTRSRFSALAALCALTSCVHREFNQPADTTAIQSEQQQAPLSQMAVMLVTAYGDPFCSGSLIGRQTILTAGHCFHAASGFNFSKIYVYFGSDVKDLPLLPGEVPIQGRPARRVKPESPQIREVAQVHLHEKFNQRALMVGNAAHAPAGETWAWQVMGADIAIVKLTKAAPGSHPTVALARDAADLRPGRPVTILGFGRRSNAEGSELPSGRLHWIRSVIRETKPQYGEFLLWADDGKDTFHGDSGGPVLLEKEGGETVQVGLVSHPAISEQSARAGINAKGKTIYTSVPHHFPWIQRGAGSYYCEEFSVADERNVCATGELGCGAGEVPFEGSPARTDAGRLIWNHFRPGTPLRRLIKAGRLSGFVANADSAAARAYLAPDDPQVLGFVDNGFTKVRRTNGCRE